MKERYEFVQGDREVLDLTLERDGTPLDLTGRDVIPVVTRRDGRIDLEGGAEVSDPTAGEITLTLDPADLGVASSYQLEFRVVGGPADPTTIPREKPIRIMVRESTGTIETAADVLTFGSLSSIDIDIAKDWGNHRITNLGDPSDEQDAVTASYLAQALNGVATTTELFSGSHDDLVDVASEDHHPRYTDSEAEAAAPVASVHGRTGEVVSESGDYSADDVGAESAGTVESHRTEEVHTTPQPPEAHAHDGESLGPLASVESGRAVIRDRLENAVYATEDDLPADAPAGTQVYVEETSAVYVFTDDS